jgi:transcriptional regulator with XRE-family HTH domain
MSKHPSTLRARIKRQTRLGEMFRLYRTVRGKSLRDVAPQIGIGAATLMRIETGQGFDADTLLKLWAWMLSEEQL